MQQQHQQHCSHLLPAPAALHPGPLASLAPAAADSAPPPPPQAPPAMACSCAPGAPKSRRQWALPHQTGCALTRSTGPCHATALRRCCALRPATARRSSAWAAPPTALASSKPSSESCWCTTTAAAPRLTPPSDLLYTTCGPPWVTTSPVRWRCPPPPPCSLGADGVMVPLINSKSDAEEAVSYCLYPPQGQRSVAGDIG